ncbi:NAD kinase-like isoform X2 [Clytia hemisphaerica]|uniref:NAD kinase-like isoform X2 n=1 Tax=Clytia hemisphaerica TaxID=252671 RepID=UPI0034D6B8A2|eukprot:TCONS_00017286-protein
MATIEANRTRKADEMSGAQDTTNNVDQELQKKLKMDTCDGGKEKARLKSQTSPTVQSPRVTGLRQKDAFKAPLPISFNRTTSLYSRSMEWQKTGRGRFLFGPSPNHSFGPKASLSSGTPEPYDGEWRDIGMIDPSNQHLEWHSPPQNVLIIKKHMDQDVTKQFKEMVKWLMTEKVMTIIVEENVLCEELVAFDEDFQTYSQKIKPFKAENGNARPSVDLIVCLGGDGTLIHVSSLFQSQCPPVIAFHMGSLGFLTPFSTSSYKEDIQAVMDANLGLSLRSRLKCQVRRMSESGVDEVESEFLVLNEVVVDRGTSSSVTHVEIYCNGRFLTTLLGDGLIISTPTGSTAYSMSAGASLVHPSVPGIIVTPICPHSLSFRPIVLPAGVELKIIVSTESRNFTPMCSFDGRNPKEMNKTKYLRVTTSIYPIPCISHEDHLGDWFNSLGECLHWNRRETKRTSSFKRQQKAVNGQR